MEETAAEALTTTQLTPHQQAAFEEVYARLEDGEQYTTLRGYAGTGKTYLAGRLIKQLVLDGHFVRVCAPTHKAVQVLRQHVANTAVRAQTIHAFLGLRLVPDRKGGYTLELERGRRTPTGGIVVVDEASMVGEAEWEYIAQAEELQWLFIGDPAQLPPVNEGASPVFDLPGPSLEEVVRQQQGNPIMALAHRIREHGYIDPEVQFEEGQGVAVTRRRDAFIESALRAFSSEAFDEDGAFARVLAYRNRTVRTYNTRIRNGLYGAEAPRFVKGEWLVARQTWFRETVPYLVNSEEVRVESTSVEEYEERETGKWKIWRLKVYGEDDAHPRYLQVLHEDEIRRFDRQLAKLKHAALKDGKDWKPYYALRERFAGVDYAYAMTVHKAQGSTFDTAFVDFQDTWTCPEADRQALLYVAVTRPARRLALLA